MNNSVNGVGELPVVDRMRRLSEELNALDAVVSGLMERLGPYLGPGIPVGPKIETKEVSGESAFIQHLDSLVNEVRNQNIRLSATIQRLSI